MKNLLSIEDLSRPAIEHLFAEAVSMKKNRGSRGPRPLEGQVWALIFSKSSTRTRVSFEVGIRELGGDVMFLNAGDLQLGRGEPIKDTARVLGRMVHGAVIRTFAQRDVEEFARYSGIPTLNALTDDEHPCQILADIFTYEEKRGPIQGRVVTFLGDGACNVTNSWILAAAKLEFDLRVAAPGKFWPRPEVLKRATRIAGSEWKGLPAGSSGGACTVPLGKGRKIVLTESPQEAASGADMLYTDVWVSMGKEAEATDRLAALAPYQVNRSLVKLAKPDALLMHCLPAYRGKEIDEETFESNAGTIFEQAENRLHVQKAILKWAVS
ncbi:MAG TPA: ornithine carbamoyltransferase [Verrucomicrobiae bacterium]|nr:ornithine carbamoyltransferase [Verrucomicrobiae bacterium]